MGDEVWFPPGEAAMGRGEEELPPDATMLMGDDVLQEEEMESFGWSLLNYMIIQIENIQTQETMGFFLWLNNSLN